MAKSNDRIERDTLGKVKVASGAYFGAQTQRAVENFKVSGFHLQPVFIWAQAIIKQAAAKANLDSGKLDMIIGEAIINASSEITAGKFKDQFVVDVFQAGAGTSQNMNINEVIANRANETLGAKIGEYKPVHPNDHVNMGQSTNDTIHGAIHIAAYVEISKHLLPSVKKLADSLRDKAREFDDVLKVGRTHLQDAVPIRLGQEFGAYEAMIRADHERIELASKELLKLAIGGSAVGTGLNAGPEYREKVIEHIRQATGFKFSTAGNMFEAMQSFDAVVSIAGALRVLVVNLSKIADDFRLLSSGPRAGLAEISLPAVQPGSSIMPGKVNPVMAEMLNMVCYQAMGCDTVIAHAARAGQLELNVMMPVIAYNLLMEIEILYGGIESFTDRCVSGIMANIENCRKYAERSPALATALNPHIGYNKAAEIAKEALDKNLTIRELVVSKNLFNESQLEKILDIREMTGE
ncbi:MAG: aspartate ammonia-lyase [candidate division Zixibacteria bacterium]|nr:aspartate ammonia-lyase [candidate division Zixibacteria bacterium]